LPLLERNISTTGSFLPNELLDVAMLLKLIVVLEACAMNLYQTSSSGVPAQVFTEIPELVAAATVPAMFEQTVEEDSVTALAIASLPGVATAVVTKEIRQKKAASAESNILDIFYRIWISQKNKSRCASISSKEQNF
jgi:hypothetical protein